MFDDPNHNMGYTTFYDNLERRPDAITWKDIFSEFRKKHTKKDMEYAMLAGTSLDQADESNMLIKWEKPWLFWRVFLIGLFVIGVIYLMMLAAIRLSGSSAYFSLLSGFNLIFVFIPPLIFPLVVMIFFWELNIPRNVSIYQMLLYYLTGGILSLILTVFLDQYVPVGPAAFAPFSEEPGKLLAAVFILWLLSRKSGMKIYGLTGLAVGAAVGAGFGGFESVQYAYNSAADILYEAGISRFVINIDLFQIVMESQFIRGVYAVGGHTVFCAPYAAAFALHMKDNRIRPSCVFNRDFFITFGCSVAMHFFWNSTGNLLLKLCIIAVLWINTLYITRKCLRQVVSIGHYQSGDKKRYHRPDPVNPPRDNLRDDWQTQPVWDNRPWNDHATVPLSFGKLTLRCVSGMESGKTWTANGESLTIGRNPDCSVCLPDGKVSRNHCAIYISPSGWTLRDTGSKNGVSLGNGQRLPADTEYPLNSGEIIYLGGGEVALQIIIQA